MSFPTMTSTWEFTRVGLTNVIPLVENGGPYTIDLLKAGGTYTAQLLWSPNLDASIQDDSWEVITILNTSDEVAIALPATARAIMVSITVRPTPVVDKGIATPIAPCQIVIATVNPKGVQNQRRHASGYGASLFINQAPSQDPYAALILADMVAQGTGGTFWEMQDGQLLTLTDTGPDGATDMVGGVGAFAGVGPWPLAVSIDDAFWNYRSIAADLGMGIGESASNEVWFNTNAISGNQQVLGGSNGPQVELTSGGEIRVRWLDPTNYPVSPTWAATTAYSLGDRVENIGVNNRVYEAEVAGTSGSCEPTFPTDLSTVADGGTLVWRDVGPRIQFNDFGAVIAERLTIGSVSASVWHHLVVSRTPLAYELWFDGVLVDTFLYPAVNTFRGTFGTPTQFAFATTDYTSSAGIEYGITGGSDLFKGRMCYAANYRTSLTAAQVVAHYAKGVSLGL